MQTHHENRQQHWAALRLAVIEQAGGVCARCGDTGADTAFRSFDGPQLLAAHTRCVVGLRPVAGR